MKITFKNLEIICSKFDTKREKTFVWETILFETVELRF